MIREIARAAAVLAGIALLAGCFHKPQVMDGPDMMYDFASYELRGDWTEIFPDSSMKLSFTHDELTCIGADGNSSVSAFRYELDHSVDSGVLLFDNPDFVFTGLLFRRQVYKYQPVRLLFQTEGSDVTRIFAKDTDLGYIPEGYVPTPFEPSEFIEETEDPETLDRAFLDQFLYGTWIRIGSPYFEDPAPLRITFDENSSLWLRDDGSERQIPYTVLHSPDNISRGLEIDSWVNDDFWPTYSEMRYQTKIIDGNTIRMLFGMIPVDGGRDPYAIGNIFVREEDLPLLPGDYRPDLDSDNAQRPVTVKNSYFAGNLQDTAEWLGKTPEEIGADDKYFESGYFRITGFLLKESAYGFAFFDDTCTRILIQCRGLDLESCRKEFTKLYGEPVPEDTPYLGGVGYTTGWRYRKEPYQIYLHQGSEQDFVSVELTLPEED